MRQHFTFCFVLAAMHALVCFAAPRIQPITLSEASRTVGLQLMESRETGIPFTNTLTPARASENQILLNGSGVAAGDVDGDGNCDLYFCSLEGENRLYRNLGNWRFADVTADAGFSKFGFPCTGALLADLDGDGDLDLLVNSVGGGARCFLNDGMGHFTERKDAGFDQKAGGSSFAAADVDADGDLDLYVVNYRATTIRTTGFPTVNIGGRRMIPKEYQDRLEITPQGLVIEHGEPDMLYLNDGHGVFRPLRWTGGNFLDDNGHAIEKAPRDWGLSAIFYDVNGDGAPDLYVCNDFQSPDRFWLNDGKGIFRAAPSTALRCTPTFSMSVDFADLDRDGNVDFLAADMLEPTPRGRLCQTFGSEESKIGDMGRAQVERNTLQLGHGDCTFADVAHLAGLAATGWTWGVVFLDLDLDGFEDVLMTRGNLFNPQDRDANERIERGGPYSREMIPKKLLMYPPHPESKAAFRNDGHLRFTDASVNWGFDQKGVAHGICLADLDNDGDLDVVVNNLNAPAGIYRNDCKAPRVAVRLKGENGNTHGIGAKIELIGASVASQSQQMISGGRYLSSDDTMRVFAAGARTNQMTLTVTWRDRRKSIVENVVANNIYTIAQADTSAVAPSKEIVKKPWFEDMSALIGHTHHEEYFNDFARQALLPKKLSQLGPGIAWVDVNGDDRDDLAIGSGKGGALTILENQGAKFLPSSDLATAPRDQTAVVGWPHNGAMHALLGISNYEDGQTNAAAMLDVNLSSRKADIAVQTDLASSGPLALVDIDGDGSLELFLGGRVIPGSYPEAASSRILRWRDGKWENDPQNNAALKNIGLVSGAVWTDLDNDGYPELVLACEWGPVNIFANDKGTLRLATKNWGLDTKIGWWNGISAGDFDGDGKMDLIASNWGLNTKYQVRGGHGPRIYYDRWGAGGEIEPIEAVFDDELQKWLPERDLTTVGKAIPFIREKFQTHRAYAEAGIEGILGDRLKDARVLEANWLETTVFLNRGDHFELGKLPLAAQFAPAFGVNVADFDGDGNEDIFLSQNFFAVQPQAPRNDSGRGLLLRGDGRGGFARIDAVQCGIKVHGEQRGSAAGDYDADGRVDLAVTQNGAATMLFHNTHAKPGLRIRLKGATENPQGLGAILRLGFKTGWGPAREIHGGSGYWSEDSTTQVMATPTEPERIEVLWPGGKKIELKKIPAGAREIEIDQAASAIKVVR